MAKYLCTRKSVASESIAQASVIEPHHNTMSAPLSKKQQKAQSFRAKQKAKRAAVPDLPEQDDDEVTESADLTSTTASKAKDSKPKVEEDEAYAPLPEKKEKDADGEKAGGKKKRKRDDGAEDAEIEGYGKTQKHRRVTEPKPKKEVQQRFILFLGNIGFKTTKEQVAEHFKESVGECSRGAQCSDRLPSTLGIQL